MYDNLKDNSHIYSHSFMWQFVSLNAVKVHLGSPMPQDIGKKIWKKTSLSNLQTHRTDKTSARRHLRRDSEPTMTKMDYHQINSVQVIVPTVPVIFHSTFTDSKSVDN